MPVGSLQGIRVLDITASVAGPFATQILGDLGADVIKVERVDGGDDTRRWGPPFWAGESPMFLSLNRNKRSLALDVKSQEGHEVLRELVARSDVLVQNLRPGALAKLGFDYPRLHEINPRLICCDMTGYGHAGPLRERPAYDPLMQAFSGLMSLTGEPGGAPVRIPASLLDQGTAMWTVIGVLDALRTRETTGEGCQVQTSLLQTAMMWLPSQLLGYFADGELPVKQGSGTRVIAPYQAFPTADGHVIIAAGNDNLWRRLCSAIQHIDLAEDPRFSDNPSRVANREELAEALSETLRTRTTAQWQEVLGEAGVPVTPVRTVDEVVEDEQVQAVGILRHVEHPRIPDYTVINTPICRDGEYLGEPVAPPELGAHTAQIMADLGYSDAEAAELVDAGVIVDAGGGES
jgi:formyl-CoA transferase/CoA:oxalate CoA-transferase